MNPEPPNKKLLFCIVLFLAVMAYSFSSHINTLRIEREQKEAKEEERVQILATTLESTEVVAQAVSVHNITKDQKIFGKNDDIPMPLASLAKSMTIITALNAHGLDGEITISGGAIKQAGDSGLTVGQKWKMSELAKLTLISSSNDGAYAMWEKSEADFIDKMNTRAKKLGMKHAKFINTSGLDIMDQETKEVTAGAFGTAEDANIMASFALLSYPQIFEVTTKKEITLSSLEGTEHKFLNTDIIVEKIPNIIFSKTGYTVVAGGNLSIVFIDKIGDKIAVTLLGSTFEDRFHDMEKIVNVLYSM